MLYQSMRGLKLQNEYVRARLGSAWPHMKISIAAYPFSGQVWMDMCDSARTATPVMPPDDGNSCRNILSEWRRSLGRRFRHTGQHLRAESVQVVSRARSSAG